MKELILKDKIKETDNTWSFVFVPRNDFNWEPGQFLIYEMEVGDKKGRRYFTIASHPKENNIRLTTRIYEKRSDFKDKLFSMEKDEIVQVEGPDGSFVVKDTETPKVFIAGGVGITPFRSILKVFEDTTQNFPLKILYGNGSQDFVFEGFLDRICESKSGFEIEYLVSPEKVTEGNIEKSEEELADPTYFISGPAGMVDSLGEMITDIGVSEDRIKHDHFPGYDDWSWSEPSQ